jgi:lysozyme
MKHSEKIRTFIASCEGFRNKAYQPVAGDKWTIGYGFTYVDGTVVQEGDTITVDDSNTELDRLLTLLDIRLNTKKIPITVTQQQYDAVVSLVYNIGYGAFNGAATGKLFYAGLSITDKFLQWSMFQGQRLPGLVNRRNKEKEIYDTGIYS